MKFDRKCDFTRVVDPDPVKANRTCAWLTDGWLASTDGVALMVVPVIMEQGDVDGAIPIGAIADSIGLARATGTKMAQIECGEVCRVGGNVFQRDFGQPLPWSKPLKHAKKKPEFAISLNLGLMLNLICALGMDKVTLEVYGPAEPIIVRDGGHADDPRCGVLMPLRGTAGEADWTVARVVKELTP